MEHLPAAIIIFGVTLICKFVVNCVFVSQVFFLSKRKVRFPNFIFGVLLISLIEITPVIIGYCFYPDNDMDVVLYCILVFPNPFVLFLYYPVYRHVFRMSDGAAAVSLEWLIMAQYLGLLFYAFFCNILSGIMGVDAFWSGAFAPDLLALIITAVFVFLTNFVMRKYISASKRFLALPSNYGGGAIVVRRFANTFFSVTVSYLLSVTVRLMFLRQWQYRAPFAPAVVILYGIMIVLQAYLLFARHNENRRTLIEWQTKETAVYINSLLTVNTEFRRVKHDFYNILQTYGGYLENEDLAGLRKYHRSLTQMTTAAGSGLDVISSLRGRPPVHTLFSVKKQAAEECGIEVGIKGADVIAGITMNDLDLCRILSNLLDNAIQAAAESKNKRLQILCSAENNMAAVQISNSTKDFVDIGKIFERDYTTKAGHSGQGLKSVRKIINTHPRNSLSVAYEKNMFTAKLILEWEPPAA